MAEAWPERRQLLTGSPSKEMKTLGDPANTYLRFLVYLVKSGLQV